MTTEPNITAAAVFTFLCAGGAVVMLAASAALWTSLVIGKRAENRTDRRASRPP